MGKDYGVCVAKLEWRRGRRMKGDDPSEIKFKKCRLPTNQPTNEGGGKGVCRSRVETCKEIGITFAWKTAIP